MTYTNVIKHLPGKHDQSTHGRGGYEAISKPEMMAQFEDWEKGLTVSERSGLDRWQGGNGRYKEINGYLRADDNNRKWMHKGELWKSYADDMQTALQKGELKQDTVLFRAMALPELHPKHGNKLIGITFKDNGFTATTIDEKYADKFITYTGSKGYYVKVNAKKGTKGAFMDKFKDLKESEFLLPHGTSFIITGVNKKTKTVEVEILYE